MSEPERLERTDPSPSPQPSSPEPEKYGPVWGFVLFAILLGLAVMLGRFTN